MICGIHVGIEREITFTTTIKRTITIRSHNPILPFQIFEAHVKGLDLTTSMILTVHQWIPEFWSSLFVSATTAFPLGISFNTGMLTFVGLDHLLSFEERNHERLVFLVATWRYETDFIKSNIVIGILEISDADVETTVLIFVQDPLIKRAGHIDFNPTLVVTSRVDAGL